MGFRDLKAFNLALLAKQGWRIMQNPHSLVHKVFKAKYFMDSPFEEAQLGRRPSYEWRSIMAAKQVINRGSRWCIGNGASVCIWKDRWIPKLESFKASSPHADHQNEERVSSLLDAASRCWDVAKVRAIFLPHEAEAVLSIPISFRLPEDSMRWAWSSNGKFSVKSAYLVAQKWLKEGKGRADGGSSSNNSSMKAIWKLTWHMNCLNKIKHFFWRACKNILPTKLKLKDKGIGRDDRSEFCEQSESSGHALWSCKTAEEVWSNTKLKLPFFQDPPRDFIDIVWAIYDTYPGINWELFAVIAWSLWNNRNKVCHGE